MTQPLFLLRVSTFRAWNVYVEQIVKYIIGRGGSGTDKKKGINLGSKEAMAGTVDPRPIMAGITITKKKAG